MFRNILTAGARCKESFLEGRAAEIQARGLAIPKEKVVDSEGLGRNWRSRKKKKKK